MKTTFAATVFAAAAALSGALSTAPAAAATYDTDTLAPGQMVTYTGNFDAGVATVVGLFGDEASDLDLFVYDENGVLIASSDALHSMESVTWTPLWTGEFRIEVINVGSAVSSYQILLD